MALTHAISQENESISYPTDMRTDLEPRTVEEAMRVATIVAKASLYGVRTTEEAFIRIATGKELGLTAMQSLRGIHVMNGRAVLDSALLVALVKAHPACEYFKLVESNDQIATYKTSRKGEGETTMSFTVEQAKRAKLLDKDVWKFYPEAMLRARAAAALARAVYPDQLNGLYLTEEIESVTALNRPRYAASYVQANPMSETFDLLRQAMMHAKDQTELERVGGEVKKEQQELKITAQQRLELIAVYKTRAMELGIVLKKARRSTPDHQAEESEQHSVEEHAA
jgi:hypothetical protein